MSKSLIVVHGFVKGDKLRNLLEFCAEQTYILPPYRGKLLKRSPKATFVSNDQVGVYRFGQEIRSYGNAIVGFPDPLMELACEIAERFGENPNHCIIVRYSDGKEHHIPWHSDKQEGTIGAGAKDICSYTNIYDIVIFEGDENTKNRRFQVALTEDIEEKVDGHGLASKCLYDERTPNGDMIVLTFDGNCTTKHRVPKEKGNDVVRYSIVFRTIKTMEEQGLDIKYGEQEEEVPAQTKTAMKTMKTGVAPKKMFKKDISAEVEDEEEEEEEEEDVYN
jgi:hypothetical protein